MKNEVTIIVVLSLVLATESAQAGGAAAHRARGGRARQHIPVPAPPQRQSVSPAPVHAVPQATSSTEREKKTEIYSPPSKVLVSSSVSRGQTVTPSYILSSHDFNEQRKWKVIFGQLDQTSLIWPQIKDRKSVV